MPVKSWREFFTPEVGCCFIHSRYGITKTVRHGADGGHYCPISDSCQNCQSLIFSGLQVWHD